jgi:predicted SAM-dependent methyltransferase
MKTGNIETQTPSGFRGDMIKLHVGCGHKKIPGYVNVDANPDVKPDVIDTFDLQLFQENSISCLYCCHAIEHLPRELLYKTLYRWNDLLIKDGVLRLSVPDFEAICKYYTLHQNLPLLKCLIWGDQSNNYQHHYNGFDFESLKSDLQSCGFRRIKRYDWRETEHAYIDDYSSAYLPRDAKNDGMLMSLNVECLK